MSDFHIAKGTRLPALVVQLSPEDIPSLEGATVQLRYRSIAGGELQEKDGEVESVDARTVKYEWAAGETDVAGTLKARFRVTFASGKSADFPNRGWLKIAIADDL